MAYLSKEYHCNTAVVHVWLKPLKVTSLEVIYAGNYLCKHNL